MAPVSRFSQSQAESEGSAAWRACSQCTSQARRVVDSELGLVERGICQIGVRVRVRACSQCTRSTEEASHHE